MIPRGRPGWRPAQPSAPKPVVPVQAAPAPDDISHVLEDRLPRPTTVPAKASTPATPPDVLMERRREVEWMIRDRTLEILAKSGDHLWDRLRSHLLEDSAERGGSLWNDLRKNWCEVPF